ncbi:MAG: AAA family ATPase [Phycisphaerales bacterium]
MKGTRSHDPIDAAFREFEKLVREIGEYQDTIVTEQDTRVKVIDRLFTEVLGWPMGDLSTEVRSGEAGFVDYLLKINGFGRLVVEAKRDGKSLDLEQRHSGQAYVLSGPVFSGKMVKSGLQQAANYCGQKNTELACVTNGREWIVFRGSRLGDGKDTFDGKGFVFSSLQRIAADFTLFYDLLSRQSISQYKFRAMFQEAEGVPIRAHTFRRSLVRRSDTRILAHGQLTADIDKVMTSFFRRLAGDNDPDLLVECFVSTTESQHADMRLAHIADELISTVRSIGGRGQDQLSEIIERVKRTQRNAFVLLVGRKGSGKSTFVQRFFRHMLRKELASDCVLIRIDLAESAVNTAGISDWLNKRLLEITEKELFERRDPSYEEVQGMFFDEYRRWQLGTMRELYETDKPQFKIEFGKHIESIRQSRPHDYLMRLIGSITRSRQKVPCIVFDNADHYPVEFQEEVFRYARSIYEREIALVIVPVTDQTTWNLARGSDRTLKSFESEVLFLPTPSPKKVLERRIEFLQSRIERQRIGSTTGYFFGRGISLSLDNLAAFVATLQRVFLQTPQVMEWISELSNWNIRRCLELSKETVASPHVRIEQLLAAYVANSAMSVSTNDIKRAIIRGRYEKYPVGQNDWVFNIYDIDAGVAMSPLLPLRVLTMLNDVRSDAGDHKYVSIDQLLDYFGGMGVESSVVAPVTQRLLEAELCTSYDPTVIELAKASRIEITPSGEMHRRIALSDWEYMNAMVQVTEIMDKDAFERMNRHFQSDRGDARLNTVKAFVEYLCEEDRLCCRIPEHVSYESQFKLASKFTRAMLFNRVN